MTDSYVEQLPAPGLTGVIRTVWIQQTGASAYVQRHLPTRGVELHLPIGPDPQLVGPLTGPIVADGSGGVYPNFPDPDFVD